MTLFILSLLALAAAPLLAMVLRRLGHRVVIAERICYLILAVLVVGHIFPESFQSAGWWACLALAIGILMPTLMEKALHQHESMHAAMIILVTAGLAVHGLMDGVALGLSYQMGADMGSSLPIAVVLHRIPEAVFLWWMTRAKGLAYSWSILILLGVTTCLGFVFATGELISLRDQATLGFFQALVGGSLVHLAVHRPDAHDHHHGHNHTH
jgi:zinc transporter ZupT